METVAHPESGLTKATWTDQDLDAMSWDRCRIHALAITGDERPPDGLTAEEYLELDDVDDTAPPALELNLDLDYIVRRVQPPHPLHPVEFWVSPATLTFSSVGNISGDLRSLYRPFEMKNLHRLTPIVPRNETRWRLEGQDFDLTFRAWSFRLHLRRPPILGDRVLRMADRGGYSFAPHSFA